MPFGLARGDVNADGVVGTPGCGGGGPAPSINASCNADYDQAVYLATNNIYEVRADLNLDGVIDWADTAVAAAGVGTATGRKVMSAVGVRNRIAMKAEYTFFDAYFDATKNQSKWTLPIRFGGIVIAQLLPVNPDPGRDYFRLPVDPNDKCAQVLNDAQNDPEVVELLLELARKCGAAVASKIKLYSDDCGGTDDSGARESGAFRCKSSFWFGDSREIRICRDPNGDCPSLEEVIDTLQHELRHAIQSCEAGGCFNFNDDRTCLGNVKQELEAYCEEKFLRRDCCGAFGLKPRPGIRRCQDADTVCSYVAGSAARWCGGGRAGEQKAYKQCMSLMGCLPPSPVLPPAPPSLIPKCARLP